MDLCYDIAFLCLNITLPRIFHAATYSSLSFFRFQQSFFMSRHIKTYVAAYPLRKFFIFQVLTPYAAAQIALLCFCSFWVHSCSFWSSCLIYHMQNKIKRKYVQNDDKINKIAKYGGLKICLFSVLASHIKKLSFSGWWRIIN